MVERNTLEQVSVPSLTLSTSVAKSNSSFPSFRGIIPGEELRRQITALGADVVELPGQESVTYRVFDFFVEIIPRKRRLTLLLNLDFEEAVDPSRRAQDASQRAFVINAQESGGVLITVQQPEHVTDAMHIVQQAYERVSE